ncbi:MAG: UDP-N-acetylmuramate--L-alanine ligase [Actinomycetota bacterium]|nr:UDP-N-acetylmuramate--L-alanine ligase [Actinomycetota bacterium]
MSELSDAPLGAEAPMRGRALHFIAIGGAGMSGLALACHALGARVSGSDRAESTYVERLRAAGVEPSIGHDPDAVPPQADVVVSTAIGPDNVELVRALERGQRVIHRGELLAELCASRRLIAVAGAHGKTTTSGMIAHALLVAGADPGFLLGGELPGGAGAEPANATNARWGGGRWVVAEADESDGSFLQLRPEVAVVTNVELDHHSHWGGEGELVRAFTRFSAHAAALVRPAEPRLAALDGAGSILSFAVDATATGRPAAPAALGATDVVPVDGGSEFTVVAEAIGKLPARLGVPGRHNVANAVAAIGALLEARKLDPGLPPIELLIESLASFPGMSRRLQRKGRSAGGAVIYDDYAHHPTEVEAALAALGELPHSRLIAVFQPHLYSRTKALAPRFGRALAAADEVNVLDVYPARELPVGALEGVSGLAVAEAAADAAPGRRVRWLVDVERGAGALEAELRGGDILVTLGAGDVDRVADELVEAGGESL